MKLNWQRILVTVPVWTEAIDSAKAASASYPTKVGLALVFFALTVLWVWVAVRVHEQGVK